ncbi:hypothetical protein HY004_03200 [Candidatus Saccharibacteria bacterium]|nr:hypothetical protein [Candidatus Saccharibacteria bacterium]
MTAIYLTHSLRATAITFVIILIPIYLMNIGYSMREVFMVFIAESIVWLIFLFPAAYLMPKLGANFNMALSTLSISGFLISLALLPSNGLFIIGYVIFMAIASLYWFAFRLNFIAITKGKEAGNKIGLSNALWFASQGIAPAVGGIVAQIYGIEWTYAIAIVLVFFAAVPLWGKPDVVQWPKMDLSKLNVRKIMPDLIANAGSTVDDSVGALVWPLLVFIIIPNYAGVGILSALVVISAILISLWVGWRESKKGEAHYLKQGSWILSITNFLRFLTQTVSQVAGINLLSGVGQALYTTPMYSRYYKNAASETTLEYVFAMQIVSGIAWAVYPLLLLCLTFVLPDKEVLIFGALLAIPATWSIRFMRTGNIT